MGNLDKNGIQETAIEELLTEIDSRNKEWEEERKKEQQLPWNRFKRLMGYVGWYWFWKKVSKVCYSFHSFFSNLHAFIIRHCL